MMKKIFCIFILFISSGNLFAKTEYIKEGNKILLAEGRIKVLGQVKKVYPMSQTK